VVDELRRSCAQGVPAPIGADTGLGRLSPILSGATPAPTPGSRDGRLHLPVPNRIGVPSMSPFAPPPTAPIANSDSLETVHVSLREPAASHPAAVHTLAAAAINAAALDGSAPAAPVLASRVSAPGFREDIYDSIAVPGPKDGAMLEEVYSDSSDSCVPEYDGSSKRPSYADIHGAHHARRLQSRGSNRGDERDWAALLGAMTSTACIEDAAMISVISSDILAFCPSLASENTENSIAVLSIAKTLLSTR
jgi:hypothetical protein